MMAVKAQAEKPKQAPPMLAGEGAHSQPEKVAGPEQVQRSPLKAQSVPAPGETMPMKASPGRPGESSLTTAPVQRAMGNAPVKSPGTMPAPVTTSKPGDADEQEADRAAQQVMRAPAGQAPEIRTKPASTTVQRQEEEQEGPGEIDEADGGSEADDGDSREKEGAGGATAMLGQGQPLPDTSRGFFEQRFRKDFSGVRVHTSPAADQAAEAVNAKAFTSGKDIVFGSGQFMPDSESGKGLLAHELTHVVQQGGAETGAIQRRIRLGSPGPSGSIIFTEMNRRRRRRFARRRFSRRTYERARGVLEDMASSVDDFNFDSESELETEVTKRLTTTRLMIESQTGAHGKLAFGYPFTGSSLYWGPRVNYAARAYWTPAVVDNYSRRRDRTRRRMIERLPRGERHTVYGDPGSDYEWRLTDAGKRDPYMAITKLFVPQSPHKRTLLHCDYLVSLVHFLSFASAVGRAQFNQRIADFGVDRIVLRWNAFHDLTMDLSPGGPGAASLFSLQRVRPTSPDDLIIGDHVYFWNHQAYDLLNTNVGNAWRLENAVLVERRRGQDIFLGHGSGRKTGAQMLAKLAEEYNDVARRAMQLVRRTGSRNPTRRQQALDDLHDRFPNLFKVGNEWRIRGHWARGNIDIDQPLRTIRPSEVIGLRDPADLSQMNLVYRPLESR